MRSLPRRASIYISAVIVLGIAAMTWYAMQSGGLAERNSAIALGVATLLAALAHFASVQGSTPKSSYDLALVVYGFVLVTHGPAAAILVSTVACVLDWAWHRPQWYVQLFNICSLALALAMAGALYQLASGGAGSLGLIGAAGVFGAVLIFTVLNHTLVGLAVRLATGESLSESGILGGLTFFIDLGLVAAGAATGIIYLFNPYASAIALIPVYLISTTLRVPALERQATSDPKTGVYNARHFQDLFDTELARANRFDRPLTVVMGDLDLLRDINNVYGHLAGDQVLVRVAQILRDSVRDYDVVARFGGEEFTILMPETSLEQAVDRIEALRRRIAEERIEVMSSVEPIQTTMSFGLAQREGVEDTSEDIVHRADLAVYKAKYEGRNCVRAMRADADFALPGGLADTNLGVAPGHAGQRTAQPARPLRVVTGGRADPELSRPASGPSGDGVHGAGQEGRAGQRPDEDDEATATAAHRFSRFDRSSRSAHVGRGDGATPRSARTCGWAAGLLIAGVVGAAGAVLTCTAVASWGVAPIDWVGVLVLAGVAVITEALSVEVYVRDTSVSTSAAALVAGAVLFGPVGAVVIGITIAASAMIKHHSSPRRLAFNSGTQVMAGLACVWISRLVGVSAGSRAAWLLIIGCVAGALAVYAISTGLVSIALSLESEDTARGTWVQQFSWLWPYYLGLGALAFCLVFGYLSTGLVGVAGLVFPLLLLRLSQKQYIDHTVRMVGRLRAANAELKERARENAILSDELLLLLSGTLDLRDPRVLGHSRYVAQYAVAIGKEMGLSAERLELLRKAALLHDIGKLALPDAILAKEGPLTDQEYDCVKEHPSAGAKVFDESRFLQGILPIIRHHHERYDGLGYPSGLVGEEIPLETRILSVADAAEAMASDRSYRPGSTPDLVIHELNANTGTQFDPRVVAAFCRAVGKKECAIVNSTDAVRGRRDKYQVISGGMVRRAASSVGVVERLRPAE